MDGNGIRNVVLDKALRQEFPTKSVAAKDLGIPYATLSRIVCGWVVPGDDHKKRLAAKFGWKKVREFFPEAKQPAKKNSEMRATG